METKFNSQICTTREQSERLLALGLKKETADMIWTHAYYSTWAATARENPLYFHEADEDTIPAWSLSRLINIIQEDCPRIDIIKNVVWIKSVRFNADNIYDNLISAYEWLIKEGNFNKEYLV